MIAELVHTSLVRGLDGGTGFAVAARTGGMPRALADAIGALSGLPEAWSDATDSDRSLRATRPIAWQGRTLWIASVIRPCGLDHTGRGNRLAHHRVIDPSDFGRVDPASLLLDGPWREAWQGEPRELDAPASLEGLDGHHGPCTAWSRAFGDAGIAAAALERALRSGIGAWIALPSGSDRHALLRELVALLPARERWKRGWSTRPLRPGGAEIPVICLVDAREPELSRAPSGAAWIIDARALEPQADASWLRRAREGVAHEAVPAAAAAGRIAVAPPRRLAAPTAPGSITPEVATPEVPAAEPSRRAVENAPIQVELVRPRRAMGWWWLLALLAAIAAAIVALRGGIA